jgi:hypothetical protein
MSMRFPPRSSSPVVAVNSLCILCSGSGWRYVSKNRVTRCECRKGKDRPDLSIVDHKSSAAGER